MSSTQDIIRGTYYPHIDGLRAFAVLSVLLYHAFPAVCPGGFIGVDVFFVISGYLITKGLVFDLENGKYSIGNFYVRRIRRIFPAYMAVITFSLLTGVLLYYGERLKILATTACSSALFCTNIYFERTSDYFAPGAHNNALLNLWSLSVEEQFYVFFPLFLAALYKWAPRYMKTGVWIVFLMSLALCLWAVHVAHCETKAFYWLPFRAWELMAGSLLAIHIREKFEKSRLGLVWLLVLVSSFFWITDSLPFPGLIAVVPVGCAVALLRGGNNGLVRWVMQHNATVFIGKISYSLYLFHWPLLVFSRYALYGYCPTVIINSIAVVLSFVFSIISWKYIELPLRRTKWPKMRYYVLGGGILAATLVLSVSTRMLGLHETQHSNVIVETYWDGEAADIRVYPDPQWPESENRTPHSLSVLGDLQNPQYVLWGDSHAMALSPGFNEFSQKTGINGLYINRKHTLLEGTVSKTYPDNALWIEQVLDWLRSQHDIKFVVLVNRWAVRSQGWANETGKFASYTRIDGRGAKQEEIFELGITELCQRLREMDKKVIIISSVPEQVIDVPDMLQRFGLFKLDNSSVGITEAAYRERQHEAAAVFNRLEELKLAKVIHVAPAFFREGKSVSLLMPGRVSMYYDDDHLSPRGARRLLHLIEKPLQEAFLTM